MCEPYYTVDVGSNWLFDDSSCTEEYVYSIKNGRAATVTPGAPAATTTSVPEIDCQVGSDISSTIPTQCVEGAYYGYDDDSLNLWKPYCDRPLFSGGSTVWTADASNLLDCMYMCHMRADCVSVAPITSSQPVLLTVETVLSLPRGVTIVR